MREKKQVPLISYNGLLMVHVDDGSVDEFLFLTQVLGNRELGAHFPKLRQIAHHVFAEGLQVLLNATLLLQNLFARKLNCKRPG